MGQPCGPGSAKDTRLDVGSHDVTGDIEIDADELALSRGKHRSRAGPRPQPFTPFLQARGQADVREHSESHRPACQKGPHQPRWGREAARAGPDHALGLTRSLVREGTPIGQPSASAEPQGQGPPGPASGRIGPVPRQQMTKNSILPPPPPR